MDTEHELESPRATSATPTKKSGKKRRKEMLTANFSLLPDNPVKTAPNEEEVTATISLLREDPHKTAPLVGYFPSGFDPVGDQPDVGVRVYRHPKRQNRLHLVVSPPGTSVKFTGCSFSGEVTSVGPCTYALGVFDKESGSIKVVPIASNKVLRLEPRVESNLVEEEHSVKGELSAKEKADKVKEVTRLYSTKKAISQAKKLQSLRQEDDPNSQNDLDRKIKEVAINKEALESSNAQSAARNIPLYNSSTTNAEEAYPLDKIILKGEWDYIRDVIELHAAKGKASSDVYPTFVINRIYKLEEVKDDEVEKETTGCILSYITHLIKFKDQHSADGGCSSSAAKKQYSTPSILRQRFSTMFTEAESKWLTAEKIDLLISYVLVLCLFVDDFNTDPTDIAKDLRMSTMKLRQHFINLGCKLSIQKGTMHASLPVPLKFPEAMRRQRR